MNRNRVLLVEDEAEDVGHLKHCLDEMGCQVVAVASNGEDALEEARLHRPNLVLMDIVLPGDMDGIETSRKIREDMDVPVIYITAYSDRGYLDLVWDTDPFGFIPKPCDTDTLKASIQVAMHRKSQETSTDDSRERYRELLDMVGDPIVLFNLNDGTIHHVNDRLCDLVGRLDNELIGSPIWELFPEEKVKKYASLIGYISRNTAAPYEPMFLSRADGNVISVEASIYKGMVDETEMVTLTFRESEKKHLPEWEKKLLKEVRAAMIKKKRSDEIYTICAHCKKVRDEHLGWRNLESFFYYTLGIEFSHGICPECIHGFYSKPRKESD
jgi:PAS domain S-box-containing protein